MTDFTRDEILRDIILAMAERGFTFVRAEEGDTRSDEPEWQDKATADPEWIRKWTGVGLRLAAVTKRGQWGMVGTRHGRVPAHGPRVPRWVARRILEALGNSRLGVAESLVSR